MRGPVRCAGSRGCPTGFTRIRSPTGPWWWSALATTSLHSPVAAPRGWRPIGWPPGRRLWTAFDQGSVMTTPVIRDSVIVYATGAGLLRKRVLRTGALLGADTLPGTVTMAPPVLVGDTVVFGLDHGRACALLFASLETRWCTTLGPPDDGTCGTDGLSRHGDGERGGDRVVADAAGVPSHGARVAVAAASLGNLPGEYEVYAGQVFAALDLHDGACGGGVSSTPIRDSWWATPPAPRRYMTRSGSSCSRLPIPS